MADERVALDRHWLRRLGLPELPVPFEVAILEDCLEALQIWTGKRLTEGLDPATMDEFNELIRTPDGPSAGLRWLNEHTPDYQAIVLEGVEELSRWLAEAAAALPTDVIAQLEQGLSSVANNPRARGSAS